MHYTLGMHPFEVPAMPPSVNEIYSRSRYGVFKNPSVEEFEKFCMAFIPRRSDPITTPCKLTIVFTLEKPASLTKRDLDNMLKVTFDMLENFGYVKNDNLIYHLDAKKKAGNDGVAGFFDLVDLKDL